jgi:hypothetical protein
MQQRSCGASQAQARCSQGRWAGMGAQPPLRMQVSQPRRRPLISRLPAAPRLPLQPPRFPPAASSPSSTHTSPSTAWPSRLTPRWWRVGAFPQPHALLPSNAVPDLLPSSPAQQSAAARQPPPAFRRNKGSLHASTPVPPPFSRRLCRLVCPPVQPAHAGQRGAGGGGGVRGGRPPGPSPRLDHLLHGPLGCGVRPRLQPGQPAAVQRLGGRHRQVRVGGALVGGARVWCAGWCGPPCAAT